MKGNGGPEKKEKDDPRREPKNDPWPNPTAIEKKGREYGCDGYREVFKNMTSDASRRQTMVTRNPSVKYMRQHRSQVCYGY